MRDSIIHKRVFYGTWESSSRSVLCSLCSALKAKFKKVIWKFKNEISFLYNIKAYKQKIILYSKLYKNLSL